MPINRRKDKSGNYYQYGNHGKKYYYVAGNISSREKAKNKAILQAKAIHASGFVER